MRLYSVTYRNFSGTTTIIKICVAGPFIGQGFIIVLRKDFSAKMNQDIPCGQTSPPTITCFMFGYSSGSWQVKILGVAMTISIVFMRAIHSFLVLPRMQRVHPLYKEPRISQAPMSKAIFRSWPTRMPGHMPTLPGDPLITIQSVSKRGGGIGTKWRMYRW